MTPSVPLKELAKQLVHVEFRLDWLIRLSQLENATPDTVG